MDKKTGISQVLVHSTGLAFSAHPNIDATGSVAGMKALGYWGKYDRTVRLAGYIYNTSRIAVCESGDKIAELFCQCEECQKRKAGKKVKIFA